MQTALVHVCLRQAVVCWCRPHGHAAAPLLLLYSVERLWGLTISSVLPSSDWSNTSECQYLMIAVHILPSASNTLLAIFFCFRDSSSAFCSLGRCLWNAARSINLFSLCSVRFLCVIAASFKIVISSDDVLLHSGKSDGGKWWIKARSIAACSPDVHHSTIQ